MKKFKIWVAVDDNGNVYVYGKDMPYYITFAKYWTNPGANFSNIGCDSSLKAGEDAIKEIEFELPLKEESNEKDK